MPKPFAGILEDLENERLRKMEAKVPSWAGKGLVYPTSLSTQQCSGEEAALYKASVAERICGRCRVVDLTGGLGVDSWAFSGIADEVIYVERDAGLSDAAKRNFAVLGADNIHVNNCDCREYLGKASYSERNFVFIDPARRDASGKKVFRIADCQPSVIELKESIFGIADNLLVKLSPMADISQVRRELGDWIREIHILSSGSEVKELLVLMTKGWTEEAELVMAGGGSALARVRADWKGAAVFAENPAASYLYEPTSLLAKSGKFNYPCERWDLEKIAPSTHLYVSDSKIAEPDFLKRFQMKEIIPLNAKGIARAASLYPHSEVSARNIPITSEMLRKKLGVKSGNDSHIFGVSLSGGSRVLLICQADI